MRVYKGMEAWYRVCYQGREGTTSTYVRVKREAVKASKALAARFAPVTLYGPLAGDARPVITRYGR